MSSAAYADPSEGFGDQSAGYTLASTTLLNPEVRDLRTQALVVDRWRSIDPHPAIARELRTSQGQPRGSILVAQLSTEQRARRGFGVGAEFEMALESGVVTRKSQPSLEHPIEIRRDGGPHYQGRHSPRRIARHQSGRWISGKLRQTGTPQKCEPSVQRGRA